MKHLKMIGLLALAAAALTAFVGTASATTPTSPKGVVYTGTYKAESEGTTSLHNAVTTVTCGRTLVEGKIEQHGPGVTTKGRVTTLDFSECNYPVTVLKAGTLEAHAVVSGNNADGTVTSSGFEVTIHGPFGVNCTYTTNNTDIGTGTLTSTATTGGNATLDVTSALIPRTGHSAFCGSSGTWTGSFKVVTPSTLYIDA